MDIFDLAESHTQKTIQNIKIMKTNLMAYVRGHFFP
jgi:hypothetical protein